MARQDSTATRLFISADLKAEAVLPLEAAQANYLVNVLRMDAGAGLLAFNGRDGEWQAELLRPSKKLAALRMLWQVRAQTPRPPITYAYAPLKTARLDYLVQKAVEMGAGRLVPVITQHTQVSRLKPERIAANVIEAAEQCGVLAMPELLPEIRFDAWLRGLAEDALLVFCDEDASPGDPVAQLRDAGKMDEIVVLVGPEGGFSTAERAALLARKNCCRISLGPRILRADTAAVAALATVQTALGDWRAG